MSRVLVLRGSLSPEDVSVSSKVTTRFLDAYKAIHPNDEIEIIDVHNMDEIRLTSTIMTKQLTEEDYKIIGNRNKLLEDFLTADKVVVSSPMWNFGLPGMMKEALDAFVVAGKTFKYLDAPNEKGEIVMGLTKDKKLLMIQAMGGMNAGENDMAIKQVEAMFNLMGVKDISYVPIQANDIPGMSEANAATMQVEKIAKTF